MIRKMQNYLLFFLISLFLVTSTFFLVETSASAEESYEGDDGNNPLQIIIEPSNSTSGLESGKRTSEINMEDLFGSEQVFPFEPGFGKNSGKS